MTGDIFELKVFLEVLTTPYVTENLRYLQSIFCQAFSHQV